MTPTIGSRFSQMKMLVTGCAGFVGGYLVQELLDAGHVIVGLDNLEKYGAVAMSYDGHRNYRFVEGDARDEALLRRLVEDCDHLVALAKNERMTAATFDAALWAFRERQLKKITVLSSSMVYGSAAEWPTPEDAVRRIPPPSSTYGFQKLACEYFAQGAYEQYGLPFTIVRPFNCAGIGERRPRTGADVASGNIRLAMSHVITDLVAKVLKGQDPLHILGSGQQVRCYTYGGDLARGIRLAIERPEALNEDFNLSSSEPIDVLSLARIIWERINPDKPFRYVSDKPYQHDIQKRIPSVEKAKRLLGFEATTPLSAILDEVIPWLRAEIAAGRC
jgi:UDP-glucose 4-epimerase